MQILRSFAVLLPPVGALVTMLWPIYALIFPVNSENYIYLNLGLLSIPVFGTHASVILIIVGIALLYYSITRDYSIVFPDKLRFSVYFDIEGMEVLVNGLKQSGDPGVLISDGWQVRCKAFQSRLSDEVKQKMGHDVDVQQLDRVSARGITTFLVEKESGALQSYMITEIDGHLTFDVPLTESFARIKSFFSLHPSSQDRIDVDLMTMLTTFRILLKPLVRQTYFMSPSNEIVVENLTALTWVRFFPFVHIGNTLYVVKEGQDYTPVAYCSYRA